MFEYGAKTLSLDVSHDVGTASIRFGTRYPRILYPKLPSETTILFSVADHVLQTMARDVAEPLTLRFDTADDNLKRWVVARWEALGFDDVDPPDPDAYRITVTKRYGFDANVG